MTGSQIAAIILALLTVWFIVFVWWIAEDLNVKERFMFSLLVCILGVPAIIVFLVC